MNTNRNGDKTLQTDLGQTWRLQKVNSQSPMGDWLLHSAQRELQHWQKDMAKIVLDAFVHELEDRTPYELYMVYQKGQGYTGTVNSDVFVMHIPRKKVWFVSTTENTWIVEEKLENFPLKIEDAVGSLCDIETRKILYEWSDTMRSIPTSTVMRTEQEYLELAQGTR
jgi:hypothetical protein